jgi:hypothetical protein
VPTYSETMEFDTNGFIRLREVLSTAELSALRQDLAPLISSGALLQRPRRDEINPRAAFLLMSPTARSLLDHHAVVEYLDAWIEREFRVDHVYGLFTQQGESQLPLHHGGARPYYFAAYRRVGNLVRAGATTVLWALVDMPAGTGGFSCIPGSHLAHFDCPPEVRSFDVGIGCVTDVPLAAGDALIFTEALTHGSRTWTQPYRRQALFYKYSPGCLAWSNEQWPQTFLDLLSNRQRRLFRTPWMHDVYADGHGFRAAALDGDTIPLLDSPR